MVRFIKVVFAFVLFFAVSSAMANCQDDDYYMEHMEECDNGIVVQPLLQNPNGSQPSANGGENVASANGNELHGCIGGNITIFLNRVKAENAQIANAINNISKVERVQSIVNICSLTLKRLENSISTIRKADMSGLLAQAQKTSKCFSDVFSWIEINYGESPTPPFDTIKANELIRVQETKDSWESKLKKLKEMQKERATELEIYVQLKDLHSKSCLDSPTTEAQ